MSMPFGAWVDPSLRDFMGTAKSTSRIGRLVQSGRWSDEKKLVVEKFLHERTNSDSP